MKVLYFDTETTGINPKHNDIISIAGIIEINGDVVDQFDYKCQPFNYDAVEAESLRVNGLTMAEIKTFPKPETVYKKIKETLAKYRGDRFDKVVANKIVPAGHNVNSDVDFLRSFFIKNGDTYLGSLINQYNTIDSRYIASFLKHCGLISPMDLKLETLAREFAVDLTEAHTAMADAVACREILKIMRNQYIKER